MIYEAFMFLNEFDMLDLKLQEHGPYVDKFIITEANRNFNQIEKPYIFMEQYHRYQRYHDKIIYQKFDATRYKKGWDTQNAQRSYLGSEIIFKPDDIIISSDLDEFLLPKAWDWLKLQDLKKINHEIKFRSTNFIGFANFLCPHYFQGLIAIPGHMFKSMSYHRDSFFYENNEIVRKETEKINVNGGIHLSWFGNNSEFKEKFNGHIEASLWTKFGKTNFEDSVLARKKGNLFSFKMKKTIYIPLDENVYFSSSMKKFISKKKDWLI
jgi:beta-1,4-mannosyl-glycoprotein beta-1,4-N-acetylglucosaminyltransferase